MNLNIFYGILIPFLGTSIGAACVFFMKNTLSDKIQRALTGFAAGVMVAASVWSLIIPAIEQSASMGRHPVSASLRSHHSPPASEQQSG